MIRLGTRRSALATAQATLVADELRGRGHEVELVLITTTGDVNKAPLEQIGGTGIFVSALRDALLADEIDIAVHSLKDLPTAPIEGLTLGAIPVREDPRDVLVARDGLTLGELPPGAVIGTGSPRRVAQLDALGLGVECTGIRGNVDTRIRFVTEGKLDAVVLARAGLSRLGRLAEVTETLDPIQVLPAPGQGALGIECRADDTEVLAALAPLEDPATRAAVTAERQMLATLEAGCTAPVGALAEVVEGEDGPELWLRGALGQDDGVRRLSANGAVDDPESLGKALANELLERI
ncbi:hydroxymethylbilane synthase [Kribbella sandramycini]|uniref:Porphobilinogen deaminase n=1 Tax=Kribbella sandramycini TaxID=60450 RepID=A0A7Y4L3K9_9ACTN|nr:hydroxymethylbilane synthase [Kribbella sandramycini]MBB6564874.1 hydroxymethylbilane synthase [Kribbella sandramycini]NOL42571.1 hydroxymethylbilane synthase [Kribbella sandramycini]